ncbi:hypothetical protein FGO68_gene12104 [Halteria grandinella]|uniref:Uncharacterized protein n=1 Tax=Halteria grandinella TaxID=5974 RepID=A0A8J8NHZ2_HALGN|nr:hypothetical protein FGO68_gene12104 [Halteria grandinella]
MRDTRSQKYAAKTTGLCPMALAGKSFSIKQLQKYRLRRMQKKEAEARDHLHQLLVRKVDEEAKFLSDLDRHDKNKARRADAREKKLEFAHQARYDRLASREDERHEVHSGGEEVSVKPKKKDKREVKPDRRSHNMNTAGGR